MPAGNRIVQDTEAAIELRPVVTAETTDHRRGVTLSKLQ
jgi:hypothetical protein